MKRFIFLILCLSMMTIGCDSDNKAKKKELKTAIPPLKKVENGSEDEDSGKSTESEPTSSSENKKTTAKALTSDKNSIASDPPGQEPLPSEQALAQTQRFQQSMMPGMMPGMMPSGFPYAGMAVNSPWGMPYGGMPGVIPGMVPGMPFGVAPGMVAGPPYCPTCASQYPINAAMFPRF